MLQEIKNRAMQGHGASVDEAMELNNRYSTDELCDAADEVRIARKGDVIDTCSIVNARSGRCTEDCKWCAQSACHHTGIDEYEMIDERDLDRAVEMNDRLGVMRFSMVTSGRKVSPRDIKRYCAMYRRIAERSGLSLCASMGLLTREELRALKEAGVKRYHCNLETSADYFPRLCTTHTHDDKLRTIAMAREEGMEICCGGIIGMGESMRQRLSLAYEAREAGAVSIPVNILQPIKGTALENTPLISEDEVARTVALFRLIAPDATLRFAGGRARLTAKMTERILRGGMNGIMVGDLLTTVGNKAAEDYAMIARVGYRTE